LNHEAFVVEYSWYMTEHYYITNKTLLNRSLLLQSNQMSHSSVSTWQP